MKAIWSINSTLLGIIGLKTCCTGFTFKTQNTVLEPDGAYILEHIIMVKPV